MNGSEREFRHKYILGIDLGTTNSAVSFADLTAERPEPSLFPVLQIVAPGEVAERSLLPSFLYLPGPYELQPDDLRLPWNESPEYVVGEFAREQGALVPDRMVSSAKSWLCHSRVNRKDPILPWGVTAPDICKVSPVEASARYLEHIRNAWNYGKGRLDPEALFEEQFIILTVPASFDEVARELTVEAARMAGMRQFTLLEEPLAAFYSWIHRHKDEWQSLMKPGDVILVCDVGGGTTDFTIITVKTGEKGLRFERLAVGEHLLLGGDNMDLTLGRYVEAEIFKKTGSLDAKQWNQLCHRCRSAKEVLLGSGDVREIRVTVVGRGTRLIGGSFSATLTKEVVEKLIVEGFFPVVSLDDRPGSEGRTGLTEWGLPYVQDPAITRHLASFWCRFENLVKEETGRDRPYPDFILFNGGAVTSPILRNRIKEIVGKWFEDRAGKKGWKPQELDNPRPDLAVAFGAAYYGLVRYGIGVKVGAGSPRSYYIEIDRTPELEETQRRVLCVIPRGTEEGFEVELKEPGFEVVTNRPVAFRLLSSATRIGDQLGDVVVLDEEESTLLPPIRTVLRFGKKGVTKNIPVGLTLRFTEVGTLELWCKSMVTPHVWQLQFDVRQGSDSQVASNHLEETLDEAVIEAGINAIRNVFTPAEESSPSPDELVKVLTDIFEIPRERWSLALIRKISDFMLEMAEGRKRTFHHEARWLNLLGFCMRPGYGHPLDEWRMKQIWKIYPAGLTFPRQPQCRVEWWIFWRRVSGGLTSGQQLHIFQNIRPIITGENRSKAKKPRDARILSPQELLEIKMAAASLERLPVDVKIELGRNLLKGVLSSRKPRPQDLWSLGKIGARVPLYGPLDRVVPPEVVMEWVDQMIVRFSDAIDDKLAQCLVHLARYTGDRGRDLPEEERKRLYELLLKRISQDKLKPLIELRSEGLSDEEKEWSFGESLPVGLVLAQQS
ncbi:Hsp70 protein [Thermodesulforhabdus norvegica]|uniref:Hsp70 protein n=2 Tax=Thermodesulforhabdus norvegica TaxID=39841 RepID=A0A1I4ST90_9BACT|nr:Hsp70 protein [Thermodesulforhabdus norvegica]